MSNAIADAQVGHLQATIDQTATSDIVTNTDAQKKIVVHAVKLNVDSAVTVGWVDGSGGTALEAEQSYAANGGYTHSVNPPAFLFECSPGNDLELAQTGAGQVSGSVVYRLVAVDNPAGAGFGPTSTP